MALVDSRRSGRSRRAWALFAVGCVGPSLKIGGWWSMRPGRQGLSDDRVGKQGYQSTGGRLDVMMSCERRFLPCYEYS